MIHAGEKTFIQKRLDKDIWQNLYEFPLIETERLIENLADTVHEDSNGEGAILKDKMNDILKKDFKIVKNLSHLNNY